MTILMKIFYGPKGTGKHTLIQRFHEYLYAKSFISLFRALALAFVKTKSALKLGLDFEIVVCELIEIGEMFIKKLLYLCLFVGIKTAKKK